ncbi:hypothetical protein H8B06_20325 [Sphingobacterium sp. DN00404]|uniref:Uncharacterized protein n=1 Tax=Sphingobacterium micropteri TaxID=2763501 RepID=A0ABR7YV60_9SPHI|nr:DUF6339 family protein [Sphingobacterium micropteri]MBD1435177.1 hypothetical protein [Sphingobacterium micropteri]
MAKQVIFKEKYVKKIKDELNVDFYRGNEFMYDRKQTLMLPNINFPEGLSEKLNTSDDYKSAIQIYEAFRELEPIQASDERLWTYLSHVDLYPYMIKRWDDVQKGIAKDNKKFILDHWFLSSSTQSSLMRHAIAGLWWSVYLSTDNTRMDNKYHLTKILFRQLDFPTRTLGTYKLGRHKEAVIGILEFIEDNEDLFKTKFEYKTRFVTKHLNVIGGVKPISYYDRNFFKEELKKISEKIFKI